jgi:hypothetical protein
LSGIISTLESFYMGSSEQANLLGANIMKSSTSESEIAGNFFNFDSDLMIESPELICWIYPLRDFFSLN